MAKASAFLETILLAAEREEARRQAKEEAKTRPPAPAFIYSIAQLFILSQLFILVQNRIGRVLKTFYLRYFANSGVRNIGTAFVERSFFKGVTRHRGQRVVNELADYTLLIRQTD